jgi:hypothetical protein
MPSRITSDTSRSYRTCGSHGSKAILIADPFFCLIAALTRRTSHWTLSLRISHRRQRIGESAVRVFVREGKGFVREAVRSSVASSSIL